MSSKINVAFHLPDGRIENMAFSIRHLRNFTTGNNYRREPDKNGGYTVLADTNGDLFISKCHPVSDTFDKRKGLVMCLDRYVLARYPGYYFIMTDEDFKSTGIGKFRLNLHSAEAFPI